MGASATRSCALRSLSRKRPVGVQEGGKDSDPGRGLPRELQLFLDLNTRQDTRGSPSEAPDVCTEGGTFICLLRPSPTQKKSPDGEMPARDSRQRRTRQSKRLQQLRLNFGKKSLTPLLRPHRWERERKTAQNKNLKPQNYGSK